MLPALLASSLWKSTFGKQPLEFRLNYTKYRWVETRAFVEYDRVILKQLDPQLRKVRAKQIYNQRPPPATGQ